MGCRFQGTSETIIGDQCKIGPYSCFETVNHLKNKEEELPIRIGKGVWLGAQVVVTPGTTIGCYSVVAAGAVVTKDIPPNEMWGGVPARKLESSKL